MADYLKLAHIFPVYAIVFHLINNQQLTPNLSSPPHHRCESFESYGCELGRNVHFSRSECERSCHSERPTPSPEEPSCDLEPRPIFDCTPGDRRTIYFYVSNRDTCLSLTDRGCLGGTNKYPTREVRTECRR